MLKKKSRNKLISVLDLGFEDAQRLNALALRHPEKRFMGIEVTKAKGVVTRRHNLKLIWGDALRKLKRLRSQSVKIVTADFLFSEMKVGNISETRKLELLGMLGIRPTEENMGEYHKKRKQIAEQVKRVLIPNGRFVVVGYRADLKLTEEILRDSGFTYKVFPVPESEMGKTKFLKKIQERLKEAPQNRERMQPMKIVARKRQ